MPHGHCYLWEPGILSVHIAADVLIALAYIVIPLGLLDIIRQRGGLDPRYSLIIILFAAFILSCAVTHMFNIVTIWRPAYFIEGALKAICAVVSVVASAFFLGYRNELIGIPGPASIAAIKARLAGETRARTSLESYLHQSFAHAPYGVAKVDLDGSFIEVNNRFADMAGWSKGELEGTTFQKITHKDDLDKDVGLVGEMLEGRRTSYEMPKRYIAKDGSIRSIVLTVFLVHNDDAPAYFIAMIRGAANE